MVAQHAADRRRCTTCRPSTSTRRSSSRSSTSPRYLLEWLCRPPRWRDHYLALDQRPHYAYMKRVLQALTWLRGPNRWVLKSPQHLEQLPRAARRLPRRDDRDHAPRSRLGDALHDHDARLRRPHAAHARRSRRPRRLLDRPRRAAARRLRARSRRASPPRRRSTCPSTSSWRTTSAWSRASTRRRGSR